MIIRNKISEILNIPIDDVVHYINLAPNSYKMYHIPKKKGGYRKIFHPSKQSKAIQYVIINHLFKKLLVHESTMAYKKGFKSPIKNHVQLHSKFSFSIRIDFKDFFPSIKAIDLNPYLLKTFNYLNDQDIDDINNICFPKNHISAGLPIGAPASPIISNIVMYELDEEISKLAKKINPKSSYSRYADDLIFSSNRKEDCKVFFEELEAILIKTKSPSLRINKDKTLFMSRRNRRVITGLFITPNNTISIGRNKKRYIKKLAFDYIQGNLDEKGTNQLRGYLSFVMDTEPDFINRLVMKYGSELNKIYRE